MAKIVSSPRIEEDHALALFSETHCAIITDAGEIIVTKNGSVRPFEAIAPKIRSIRASARSLAHFLGDLPTDVVHIRGQSAMMHAYTVGSHNLVALTEVSPGARNLDAVIARVDKCLCVNVDADGHTFIQQLADMLEEF